jgi:hypothetical protein
MSQKRKAAPGKSHSLRTFFDRIEKPLARIPRWILIVFFAILPSLITLILVSFVLHSTIAHFAPVAYNDEIGYWHEIATFRQAGLNGGYYVHLQLIPAVSLFHYGAHGPAYAILIGSLAKIIGWSYTTPIFLNMALVGLAFGLFAWLRKLNQLQIILAGLAVVTCWPVLIYMSTVWEETFHQVMGILLAGIFYAAILQQEKVKVWQKIAVVVFIVIISLVRYSWALLFIPLFLLYQVRKKWFTVISIVIAFALIIGIFIAFSKIAAPGTTFMELAVTNFSKSLKYGLYNIWTGAVANLRNLFNFPYPTYIGFRLVYIGLLFYALVDFVILLVHERKNKKKDKEYTRFWEDLVVLYALSSILVLTFIIYHIKADFRIFTPLILFCLLILIQSKRYVPVLGAILCSLAFTPFFVMHYQDMISPLYHYNEPVLEETRALLAQYITYDTQTTDPWCNTLYLPIELYDYRVAAVPPGIGVSYYALGLNENLELPFRSHYVWITAHMYSQLTPETAFQLQAIADMPDGKGMPGNPPGGTLYLNRTADCP